MFVSLLRRCAFLTVVVLFVCCSALCANESAKHPAKQLVEEALSREIYGLSGERSELLERAAKLSPSYAPAKWHRGLVRFNNRWMKADEVPALMRESRWLKDYQRTRQQFPQTAQGQLALANWCRDHKLPQQERAHLNHVLDFDATNADALWRLGFQPVDGRWVARSELQASAERREQERVALAKWQPRIEKILSGLMNRSRRPHERAERQLREIDDAAAIPAMVRVLAGIEPRVARTVVEIISEIQDNRATEALMQQAVYSKWSEVRDAAARQLGLRQREAYVPAMLAAMHTPFDTRMVSFRRHGRTTYLLSMTREGQDEKEQIVQRSARPRPAGGEAIQLENYRTRVINERTARALNLATEQELDADPQTWWNWWNEENEVFVEGEKPTVALGETEQLALVDRARELEDASRIRDAAERARRAALIRQQMSSAIEAADSRRRPQRSDCLAAGTVVWTIAGPVAVQDVQVGDFVLSQDPETGELAYKPVLRTTVRPTSVLVKFKAGQETIEASGGHPLWVSGEGWIKARELQVGMELHCTSGSARITSVETGQNAETYNLVVADFNTYFIGQSKILNHDNTIREATGAIVPGLVER